MMLKAGADGLQTVFLFNDQQIKEEAYVEDINMILNTADIPNLFPPDEKAELIEKMQVSEKQRILDILVYLVLQLIVKINV